MRIDQLFRGFVGPLLMACRSPIALQGFLRRFGWRLPAPEDLLDQGIVADIKVATENVYTIANSLADLSQDAITFEQVQEMRAAVGDLIDLIESLRNPDQITVPVEWSDDEIWKTLADDLPAYLISAFVEGHYPVLYDVLGFLLVFEEQPVEPPEEHLLRVPFNRRSINWHYLGDLLTEPVEHLQSIYEWNGIHKDDREPVGFRFDSVIEQLEGLLFLLGVNVSSETMNGELFDVARSQDPNGFARQLSVVLIDQAFDAPPLHVEAGVVLGPAAESGQQISGIALTNILHGTFDEEIALGEGLLARLSGDAEADGLFAITVMPSGVAAPLEPGTAQAGMRVSLAQAAEAVRLFGRDNGGRLESLSFEAGLELAAGSKQELAVFGSSKLRLIIAASEGDSFLADILGDIQLEVDAAIAMRWSSLTGFAFEGGVGFDVVVPVDVELGPILLTQVRLSLGAGPQGLTLEGAVSGGLDVSVLAVSVDDIGLRAQVVPMPEGERGLLGPVDLKLGFKPPRGIGLVIDAGGVVSGGGYLYHDENLAEYGGVAEIGFLSLKLSAIGILTTRMPEGEGGWSLYLALFSEFPPIQLGFGITLNGVGGLVGLHRTFDDEALRERLIAGALDAIMFPQNPVANAPQIIADIRTVFPPCRDQFVFGAMLKMGWGTPSIVTIELGVIVELPDPVKIALLGQLGMILPKPETTLVEINMDMFGVADLTAGTIKLDAVIRDSHILHLITLSGAMAFRAEFAGRPNMLLSIGGFHPDFQPPQNVPRLGRMKAALPLGKHAAVELSGYVAVTSNSFQVGGRIDIWVEVAGLEAAGWFGFDALIQFSPFGFDFRVTIGFCVSFKGVTLMGVDVSVTVVGPAPWQIDGYAEVKIAGFKKKLKVELELGKRKRVSVPAYDVMELLAEALALPEAWSFGEGAAPPPVVYARRTDGTIALDPRGDLTVRQKVVPLDRQIDKFGNGTVSGPDRFSFESVEAGSAALASKSIDDWFALAEFERMGDEDRITSPSFVELAAGAVLSSGAQSDGPSFLAEDGFEEIIVDPLANRRSASTRKGSSPKARDQRIESAKDAALAGPEAVRVRKLVLPEIRHRPLGVAVPGFHRNDRRASKDVRSTIVSKPTDEKGLAKPVAQRHTAAKRRQFA